MRNITILFFTVSLSACVVEEIEYNPVDVQLQALITEHELNGDPVSQRIIPDINTPLAQLGKKLFFAKSLSGDFDTACASCHHPLLGSGDALPLPIGVHATDPDQLGTGRTHSSAAPGFDGGPTVPRNAQPIFNLALYDSVLFWDGRIESLGKTPYAQGIDNMGTSTPDVPFGFNDVFAGNGLAETQAGFPVTSPEEMKGFTVAQGFSTQQIHERLAQRLGNYGAGVGELSINNWLNEFQNGFNSNQSASELITFANIRKAIAIYERSQTFTNNPWNAYINGNVDAISVPAKKGAILFYTEIAEGGAGCFRCHSSDRFTDEQFHNIGTIQIGRGKNNGQTLDEDFGRFNITSLEQDKYAFRTPNLLNTEVTGPWGHSGAYATLESIVRYHLDPVSELAAFDFALLEPGIQVSNATSNTNAALNHRQIMANQMELIPTRTNLSESQISDIVSFLHTLTDPCVKDANCLMPWIPSPDESDPDGTRLNARLNLVK